MTKKIFSIILCAMLIGVFFISNKEVHSMREGFTATELLSNQSITVDGIKDSSWDYATAFNLDKVRQYNLNGGADNPAPATGKISVMYNSSKLYLFAEITDSTKLSNVSAWDPFNSLEYDSYKYNTDYLNINLDIKHNDPTNINQGWGSAYNEGKDVAAHFELAAGAGELTYSADGEKGWVYDTSNELFTLSRYATTHSTIYSVPTEVGYTFEMVIDLSEAGITDFGAGKTIGLYVGYWDRYDSCGGSWGEQSLTTTAFEWDNYNPWNGPGWLPEVTFVSSNVVSTEFTATQTSASIGADGIKDNAYNAATAIAINHVAHYNENATPATANMYLLWDDSYLYVFVEVIDDKHYGYEAGTWLEHRDALEMIVDLYHNTSYTGGYGGDYRADKMCEGLYKIAAGVGQGMVDSTIQGSHWMWDDQKHNGSYASVLTDDGYTVEYKIALGRHASEFMVADREIGVGVKVYDKHDDNKNGSVTVLEAKNDRQSEGPQYLSSVKLVKETPTATYTSASIGADGIKDNAYNAATAIAINHVAHYNENATPATANMYLLWDDSYLYVFVEVIDDKHYGYEAGTWLEHRDALEMIVDLYHNTSYTGGYGGDYRADKMCEGLYKIAAGVGQGMVDSTIQGSHWMWDDQKHNGSYASVLTDDGYTVEYKIALGRHASEFMEADREIGVGVKIYDKHDDNKNGSVTVLEAKNDRQAEAPQYLSSVKLVKSVSSEVSGLFNKYNNNGSYVKESCIYVDANNESLLEEISYLFHGKKLPLLERTTHYSNGRLWMEESNSGYKTEGNDMVHFKVIDGEDVVDYKVNGKTLDEYYVSLSDFIDNKVSAKEFATDSNATLLDNWSKDGSIYYTDYENVLEAYRLFTAPLWLNTDSSNENYITYSFASLQEVDETLVMSLLVSSLEIGKLSNDRPTIEINGTTYYVFSQAIISK